MQGRWAVAITQPQCENKAVFHATRQGFECYLPKYKTRTRIEPLFPRYVFVAIDGAWRALLTTIGVSGVIMNAERPSTLTDDQIGLIKSRCDAQDVYIPPPKVCFYKGQHVRVHCGPLTGARGIVQYMRGKERVSVLITMLNARVNVYEGDLSAA